MDFTGNVLVRKRLPLVRRKTFYPDSEPVQREMLMSKHYSDEFAELVARELKVDGFENAHEAIATMLEAAVETMMTIGQDDCRKVLTALTTFIEVHEPH